MANLGTSDECVLETRREASRITGEPTSPTPGPVLES